MLPSALLLSTFVIRAFAWTCYTPDGQDRNSGLNETVYQPCGHTTEFSMCCRIADTSTGGANDTCDPSGFCKNGNMWWRESCTDRTWKSPSCIKLFVNATKLDPNHKDTDKPANDVDITQCENGSWCYGTENRDCCKAGQGFFINSKDGTQTNQKPSTTSVLSSPNSSTTPTATGGNNSSTNSAVPQSDGLSVGAKAGIGAGLGVAALVAVVIGVAVFLRKRKRHAHKAQYQPPPYHETQYAKPQPTEKYAHQSHPGQQSKTVPVEVPATEARPAVYEVDGNSSSTRHN